ncbi:ATP-binding protein [Neptunicella marina]|uniref:histidine kinase n=1 Tax=Neptunicella marina TaxID=2125989 RepID=A0A8J6M0N8_9ALTE|nr:ATP-binding protein [Neptunicella marina]MBC3767555.1 sensor histidine kinase N-terminal domain-containing protein [Neptunicella marina]
MLWINLSALILLGIAGWRTYQATEHELDELFDAELAQTTRMISAMLNQENGVKLTNVTTIVDVPRLTNPDEDDADDKVRFVSGHRYESKLGFQVWSPEGKLLLASKNALQKPFSKMEHGYHDFYQDGRRWLSYSYFDKGTGTWIFAAQREDVRSELSGYIVDEQMLPLMLTWVPVSLAIFIVVSLVLAPVNRFSDELKKRRPDELTPFNEPLPKEVEPVRIATNQLLERIDHFIELEKQFINDASHELRTPLAGLKVRLVNLIELDLTEQERKDGLEAILALTDKMTSLVNQLLLIARMDSSKFKAPQPQSIVVREVVDEVISDMPEPLLEKVQWNIRLQNTIQVNAEPVLFHTLLRNLMDNAVRYSPPDGEVTISAEQTSDGVLIRIEDEGGGVPPDALKRLGKRFYRHEAKSNISGVGLGLSIVERIVALNHWSINYANNDNGLVVTLTAR